MLANLVSYCNKGFMENPISNNILASVGRVPVLLKPIQISFGMEPVMGGTTIMLLY